ncbi:MAG TPA: hypothetical protein VNY05_11300 [Candidatus Acidoferrales bacterium]|nr:hypothetical protein [Candidatus Acidoferrales bacterium]
MSIPFQADNDLKFAIVKAVRRREPPSILRRPMRPGLKPSVIRNSWNAARDNRVLVSHDRRNMLNHFRNHLLAEKPSPGLLVVSQGTPIGLVVEAIVLLWAVTDPTELRDQAYHLPSLIHHRFPR